MKQGTYVWDPLIRVFHWSLVLTFLISYLTGDEFETVHAYSGYLILALISVRIIWGFIGTKHARFSDFIRPIPEAINYLRGLFTGNAKKYTGHNPAGGLMVLALLASITITGLTGLKAYGVEGHGPLASTPIETVEKAVQSPMETSSTSAKSTADDDDDHDDYQYKNGKTSEHDEEDEIWEELHEFFANFSVLLVILHILGVYISSFFHKENLVEAMITGYKESSKK
jgi:cytochrome b